MNVGNIGYNHSHGIEFEENRPNGIGCWLLLLIKSEARFDINHVQFEVKKPGYVLISPYVQCKYGPLTDYFCNDWIYLAFDENDEKWAREIGLEIDKVVDIGYIDELSSLVHTMTYEHYSNDPYHKFIQQKYLELLMLQLARKTTKGSGMLTEMMNDRNVRFNELRVSIYNHPEEFESIDDIARNLNMSRSNLQHLYKKMFDVSISYDIITAKIEQSCRFLSTTKMTLHDIAIKCGYKNEFYFMKQFKNRVGKTPSEYRKVF